MTARAVGMWAGRLPLAQPYGEASYYLQAAAAVSRARPDIRWLLTGRETEGDLEALNAHRIPTRKPRAAWPRRRVISALRAPRIEWQYPRLDLVHYWSSTGTAPTRKPYVLTLLDGMALAGQFGEKGDAAEARRLALGARTVMTLTLESGELVRRALALPDLQLVALGAGVDAARFTPARGADDDGVLARHRLGGGFVLYTGGWAPRKGLEVLADALAKLDPATRPALALTGRPGADHTALAERFVTLGATLLGYVADSDMPALLRTATAVVIPSLAEGFGLPVIEAQASGVPVIASDLPVIRSVSDGNATLIPPGDATALAEALAGGGGRADSLVPAGLANARGHTWDAVARRIVAVYEAAPTPTSSSRSTSR